MKFKYLRMLSILLAGALLLIGCQGPGPQSAVSGDNKDSAGKITIVTSFYPMYISALNVAKDVPGVTVTNMTKPQTGCLHDYQLTPEDLKTLEGASFFIINGANMEAFMDKVLKQLPDLKIIEASRGIALMKNESDGEDNPHVWVSISNAITQVKNISEQLAEADPDHASQYRSNAEAYTRKLEAEKDKMHKALDNVSKRDIITFHEAFPYFAGEFNLNIAAVIEREPGSEPSAGELSDTVNTVRTAGVHALFAEPQYPAKAADTIARETGAKVYVLDPAVTGPDDVNAYIDIMENNLKVLEEALK